MEPVSEQESVEEVPIGESAAVPLESVPEPDDGESTEQTEVPSEPEQQSIEDEQSQTVEESVEQNQTLENTETVENDENQSTDEEQSVQDESGENSEEKVILLFNRLQNQLQIVKIVRYSTAYIDFLQKSLFLKCPEDSRLSPQSFKNFYWFLKGTSLYQGRKNLLPKIS